MVKLSSAAAKRGGAGSAVYSTLGKQSGDSGGGIGRRGSGATERVEEKEEKCSEKREREDSLPPVGSDDGRRTSVFVGGMPYDLSEEEMELFSRGARWKNQARPGQNREEGEGPGGEEKEKGTQGLRFRQFVTKEAARAVRGAGRVLYMDQYFDVERLGVTPVCSQNLWDSLSIIDALDLDFDLSSEDGTGSILSVGPARQHQRLDELAASNNSSGGIMNNDGFTRRDTRHCLIRRCRGGEKHGHDGTKTGGVKATTSRRRRATERRDRGVIPPISDKGEGEAGGDC